MKRGDHGIEVGGRDTVRQSRRLAGLNQLDQRHQAGVKCLAARFDQHKQLLVQPYRIETEPANAVLFRPDETDATGADGIELPFVERNWDLCEVARALARRSMRR